jgi:hypothetical protein
MICIHKILWIEYSQYRMNHLVDIWIIAYQKIIFMYDIKNLILIEMSMKLWYIECTSR